MEFSAKQIADFLKGTVIGNPDIKLNNFSKIEEGKPGTLTFLSNPKYTHFIYTTNASAVLVNKDFEPEQPIDVTLIKVENSYEALAQLLKLASQSMPRKSGISPLSFISESAKIGENSYVAPFAFVGDNAEVGNNVQIYPHVYVGDNTKVGDNTTIFAGVQIYSGCQVGKNCILHAGLVIGADGFGFVPEEDGTWSKLPQLGNVVVEDNVEIGANSTLDCATMGSSRVHKGVKIDNLVHLAHNVEIDENTAIAAQCGVAGSTKIGKNCILAGQVGIVGHISIPDHSTFGAQAGVSGSVKKSGQIWMGSPAIPINKYRKVTAVSHGLVEMRQEIMDMQKEIAALKKLLNKNE